MLSLKGKRFDTWTTHVSFVLTRWTLTCELWASRKYSDVCVQRNGTSHWSRLWLLFYYFSCQEFVVGDVGSSVHDTHLYSNTILTGFSCVQMQSIKMHFLTLIRTWCYIHVHWKLGHLPTQNFLLPITVCSPWSVSRLPKPWINFNLIQMWYFAVITPEDPQETGTTIRTVIQEFWFSMYCDIIIKVKYCKFFQSNQVILGHTNWGYLNLFDFGSAHLAIVSICLVAAQQLRTLQFNAFWLNHHC